MSQQKIISIIQNSQLSTDDKKKLVVEIKDKGETKEVFAHVTKALQKIKAKKQESLDKLKAEEAEYYSNLTPTEFKALEIERLVGEKNRQLRNESLKRLHIITKLLRQNTKRALEMIKEDSQKSKSAS